MDLPAPLGPTTASRPPAGIDIDRPSMTSRAPPGYRNRRPSTSSPNPSGGDEGAGGSTTSGLASMTSNSRAPAASVASSRWTAAASGPIASKVAIAASGSVASSTSGTDPRRTASIPTHSTTTAHSPVNSDDAPAATARTDVSRAVAPSIAPAASSSRDRCAWSRSSAARSPTPRTASSARAVVSARAAIRSRAGSREATLTSPGRTRPAATANASRIQPAIGSIQPSSTQPKATAPAAAIGGTATPANASSRVPTSAVMRASRSPPRADRSPAGASGSIEAKNDARRSARTRKVPAWITIRSR